MRCDKWTCMFLSILLVQKNPSILNSMWKLGNGQFSAQIRLLSFSARRFAVCEKARDLALQPVTLFICKSKPWKHFPSAAAWWPKIDLAFGSKHTLTRGQGKKLAPEAMIDSNATLHLLLVWNFLQASVLFPASVLWLPSMRMYSRSLTGLLYRSFSIWSRTVTWWPNTIILPPAINNKLCSRENRNGHSCGSDQRSDSFSHCALRGLNRDCCKV